MIPLQRTVLQGRELEYVTDCLQQRLDLLERRVRRALRAGARRLRRRQARRGLQLRHLGPAHLPHAVGRPARTTRSSCRPSPSSPRSTRCATWAPGRSSSTATSTATSTSTALRRFLARGVRRARRGRPSTSARGDASRRSSRCTSSARRRTWTPSSSWPPSTAWRSSRTPARRSARRTRAGCAAASRRSAASASTATRSSPPAAAARSSPTTTQLAAEARYLTTQAKEDGIEYIHHAVGYNYRMNNVLAALGLAQLETIDERLADQARATSPSTRRRSVRRSRPPARPARLERLEPLVLRVPLRRRRRPRSELLEACLAADIQVRPLWYPNHLQRPYADMQAYQIERALWFYDRLVNLPCSVTLTADEIAQVVDVVRKSASRA